MPIAVYFGVNIAVVFHYPVADKAICKSKGKKLREKNETGKFVKK